AKAEVAHGELTISIDIDSRRAGDGVDEADQGVFVLSQRGEDRRQRDEQRQSEQRGSFQMPHNQLLRVKSRGQMRVPKTQQAQLDGSLPMHVRVLVKVGGDM